jgi:S-adenosylmethionine:tRNA-ribosyltransferase-isomerase (queuine synthetase)
MVAMSEPESSTGRVGFAPGPDGGAGASRPMAEYEYPLPEESIAQTPAEPRSSARLLVAAGVGGSDRLAHRTVADLPELVGPGDVVVVNDTRVLTGRLHLTKATGGRAEVLLLEPTTGADEWEAPPAPGGDAPVGTAGRPRRRRGGSARGRA